MLKVTRLEGSTSSVMIRFAIETETTIRLIQIGQTGGQWYSDTSPFSIPRSNYRQAIAKLAKPPSLEIMETG